jgi:hypothetical protein
MIRVLPQLSRAEQAARRRARRRKALWNTILEALTTMGLGVCIILCAVAVVCVV